MANNNYRLVLDFVRRGGYDHLIANNRRDTLNQQWKFGDNGNIVNVGKQQSLDIHRNNFTVGNFIVLHAEHSGQN